jgi:energy-coupling factor transporter ATP-binding protein EcfA2
MGNHILDSLEIQGFRGFRHLQIEKLGRVNLIVGKNNVGKTSLLEALSLYAHEAYPIFVWELLRIRDESTYGGLRQSRNVDVKTRLSHLKYLFYGRKEVRMLTEPILIGPVGSTDNRLSINIGWFVRRQPDSEGIVQLHLIQPDEYDTADDPVPRFVIHVGTQRKTFSLGPNALSDLNNFNLNSVFIASNGLEKGLLGEFWDKIVLTDLEEDVIAALRIIAPGVERLSIAGDPNSGERFVEESSVRERRRILVPILRISGMDEPIPLRSLGDGMQRILGIALALVNAKDGMLLIDEFENGLHYSVQPDIWRLIFKVANRLNVQVFATTHSADCIKAFRKAAQEDTNEEGMLVRLENKNGDIKAILFDERRLGIATDEEIEIR